MTGIALSRRHTIAGAAASLAACRARESRGIAPAPGTSWQAILDAGRREGRVTMYGGVLNPDQIAAVDSAFGKATGIAFDFLTLSGPAAMARVTQETKVGLAPDVFENAGGFLHDLAKDGALVALKDLPLPIWSEPASAWRIHPGYKSPDWSLVLSRLRVRQGHLGINTRLLASRGIPRDWHDLATNPHFREGMVLVDPSRSTSSASEFIIQGYVGKRMTARDLYGIANAQKPMLVWTSRANVMSVAQGERAMTFPPMDETVANLLDVGVPVRNIYFPGAPIFAQTADMGVLRAGSHPNAAVVFINWVLGREGQELLAQVLHQTSVRRDVASGVLPQLRGTVVGGGAQGPHVVDSPMQARLIQDLLAAGVTKRLVTAPSAEAFERDWLDFITDWERHHGRHDMPMVLADA